MVGLEPGPYFAACQAFKKSGDHIFTKRQQPTHMRAGPGIDWQIWSIGDLPYIRVEMGLFPADE